MRDNLQRGSGSRGPGSRAGTRSDAGGTRKARRDAPGAKGRLAATAGSRPGEAQGYPIIRSRLVAMVNTGGENIYPRTVEALLPHPSARRGPAGRRRRRAGPHVGPCGGRSHRAARSPPHRVGRDRLLLGEPGTGALQTRAHRALRGGAAVEPEWEDGGAGAVPLGGAGEWARRARRSATPLSGGGAGSPVAGRRNP